MRTIRHRQAVTGAVGSADDRQLDCGCQGAGGCNPDLAAELVYVPAILARWSA
jgi:hypothetical protein